MLRIGGRAGKSSIKKISARVRPQGVEEIKELFDISADDFKKMMLASAKKIVIHQEEINKINVFPVADKDTGYNLAATLLGVEGLIQRKDYSNFRKLCRDIEEMVMVSARGNVGMIYAGFLVEFLNIIKWLETVNAFSLSLAMRKGSMSARNAIFKPIEGTILDVIAASEQTIYGLVRIKKEKNIIKILEITIKEAKIALKKTKEKLEVLKKNNVVDAGGLGFVKILESWLESLKGVAAPLNSEINEMALGTKINRDDLKARTKE